jgi:hypothetical protein
MMMQIVWQLDGERGCSSNRRWNDESGHSISPNYTRVANHDLTWASTRSPSTAYCPPDAFAGLFKHIFWRIFGLMVPGSVMAWQWRSGRRRIASNASPAGHVPAEGLGTSDEEIVEMCRSAKLLQDL